MLSVELAAKYPELLDDQNLHCYAFACPPSMSTALSDQCQNFVTSVIHSEDCISRLSIHSMIHLFNDVNDADATTYSIEMAESTLKHLVTGDPQKDWLIEQLRLRLRADAIQVAEEIGLKKNQNQNHHYQWKVPDTSPLYPSGRLIHLVQHHEGGNDGYIPLDVTNSRDRFGDMHLSRNMLSDHALKFYTESIDMGFRLK